MRSIAILTDFGLEDIYVGVMKGVTQRIAPGTPVIDLSHQVLPQNVLQAAYMLHAAYHYFPIETVFLIVVDPGVGTARRAIAVKAGDYYFVAPDNGVLTFVLAEYKGIQAHVLENPQYHLPETSQTFHGRDIFAPAAAYLATGVPLDVFGDRLDALVGLPFPHLKVEAALIETKVIHVDHFGNLVSGISHLTWAVDGRLVLKPFMGGQSRVFDPSKTQVTVSDHAIFGIQASYGLVNPGEVVAYVGSSGFLEIAVNQGSARAQLDVDIGARVTCQIGG